MNTFRTLLFLALVAALSISAVEHGYANVYASYVRVTQEGSEVPFDGSFADRSGATIRFVLNHNADSVVINVVPAGGGAAVKTLRKANALQGDNAIPWNGSTNAGTAAPAGAYKFEITAYHQGYGAYTTVYDADHNIFTRGVTAIKNPALKYFGFVYTADNGGYGGLGTGIMRHAADGSRWGDVKGLPKVANTGAVVGPANLRYSSEADWEGYVYLIGRDNREIYRYHIDTVNVALVDSGGYRPYIIEGLGIRGTGAGRYIGVAGQFNVYGFRLGNNATYFGPKDWLLASDSIYQFNDVAFGRDSMMYVTFYSRVGDSAKPGVAKFDLTGYTGTPLRLANAIWKATVDSGRANTLTYFMNPAASDESGDRIYFVNVDINGVTNPGFGVGVHAITNLNSPQPTVSYAYNEVGQNNTPTRSDVTADAAGNAIYFENTTENVAIISPPSGPNSYTYTSFDATTVTAAGVAPVLLSISEARFDGNSDRRPDRLGDTVRVIGTINSTNVQTTNLGYFMQDANAGIHLFQFGTAGAPVLRPGYRVQVIGAIAYFNGTTEISPGNLATDITVLDTGNVLTPIPLTIGQYKTDPETYESRLIQLNVAHPAGFTSAQWPAAGSSANLNIWNGVDTLILRIDSDTEVDGSTYPNFPVRLNGIATQFTSAPAGNAGYQITPFFVADFVPINYPPLANFQLLTPTNGSSLTIDSTGSYNFTWRKAVDFNNDPLIYQYKPVAFSGSLSNSAGADTVKTVTGATLLGYLGTADSLVFRWTVLAKDVNPTPVASRDTFTVTLMKRTTGVDDQGTGVPQSFALQQNYPNPFNPSTVIRYSLPIQSSVSLKIYNILGQQVITLVDEVKDAGYFSVEWHGRNAFGSQVASGTYFYRIEAKGVDGGEKFTSLKKLLLLK